MVQDVGSQCSNTEGLDGSASPIIQRKLELDKVCVFVCVSTYFFECQPVNSIFLVILHMYVIVISSIYDICS